MVLKNVGRVWKSATLVAALMVLSACNDSRPGASASPAFKPTALEPAQEPVAGKAVNKSSPRQVLKEFGDVDIDGDGTLEYDEFATTQFAQQATDPAAMFKQLDADADGELTREEIEKADKAPEN